jgi:hypothetical protein
MSGETNASPESESAMQTDDISIGDSNKKTECLKMTVFEDKDYDIEEVKFWNFISKNKGIKPSVIRTVVYKYPETSYVVKKIPVYLPKPEKTPKSESASSDNIETASTPTTTTSESNAPKKHKYQDSQTDTAPPYPVFI